MCHFYASRLLRATGSVHLIKESQKMKQTGPVSAASCNDNHLDQHIDATQHKQLGSLTSGPSLPPGAAGCGGPAQKHHSQTASCGEPPPSWRAASACYCTARSICTTACCRSVHNHKQQTATYRQMVRQVGHATRTGETAVQMVVRRQTCDTVHRKDTCIAQVGHSPSCPVCEYDATTGQQRWTRKTAHPAAR